MHEIQLQSNANVHQLSMHYQAARLASCKFWLVDQLSLQQHIGFHGHKYQGMRLVFKLNTTRLIVSSINITVFLTMVLCPKFHIVLLACQAMVGTFVCPPKYFPQAATTPNMFMHPRARNIVPKNILRGQPRCIV